MFLSKIEKEREREKILDSSSFKVHIHIHTCDLASRKKSTIDLASKIIGVTSKGMQVRANRFDIALSSEAQLNA